MPLSLRPINHEDIPAIAAFNYESTIQNPLPRLLNGTAQPSAIQERLRQYLAATLNAGANEPSSRRHLLKVVDTELADEPISWAWWLIPDSENFKDTSKRADKNPMHGPPIAGLNTSLRGAFMEGIEAMRARVLEGRKCYLLENLATSVLHSRRGAATMLLTWPFEQADRERVIVYLDTAGESKARGMYEKYGFIKVDECHLNLEESGGQGMHTHIGMIRYPAANS